MGKNVRTAVYIVALVALLGGVFFLGRGCGQGRSFRENLRNIEGELEEIATGTREIGELTEREAELVGEIIAGQQLVLERVESSIGRVDGVAEILREQQDIIASLAELDTGSGEAVDELGSLIGESLSILEQLTERTPEPDTDSGNSSGRD